MMSSVPTINLNDSDVWVSSKAFLTVWDTLHPWFEGKGYLLYPRNPDHPDRADPGTGDEYKISQEPPKYPFTQTLRDDEYQRSFFPLVRNTTIIIVGLSTRVPVFRSVYGQQ